MVGGEFVPLCRLDDRRRYRTVEQDVLGLPLGFVLREAVEHGVLDSGDRRHHQALNFLRGTRAREIAGGRRQGLSDVGPAIRRHRIGYVDGDVNALEGPRKAWPIEQIDAMLTRDLYYGDVARPQPGDDSGAGGTGRSNYGDSSQCSHPFGLLLPGEDSFKLTDSVGGYVTSSRGRGRRDHAHLDVLAVQA